jgi:hypothetical protein
MTARAIAICDASSTGTRKIMNAWQTCHIKIILQCNMPLPRYAAPNEGPHE